jgi:hypothetical protein
MVIHIEELRKLLAGKDEKRLFPCVEDLVTNGLDPQRFTAEERHPSRQDLTQYLAAWSRFAGLSADECREWMFDYCMSMLSAISSSSQSKIRHSTKGNIKYIYGKEVPFDCRRENNPFRAACDLSCPVHDKMARRAARGGSEKEAADLYASRENPADGETPTSSPSVKAQYKDQFQKAVETAQELLDQGVSRAGIAERLNTMGFKTRTGRAWSSAILGNELKKLEE